MALSNDLGWLVLTTGNKSEMSVGYATLYGDMAGGFAVIKDVPKSSSTSWSRTATSAPERARPGLGARARRPRPSCAPTSSTRTRFPPTTSSTGSSRATSSATCARDELIAEGLPAEVVDEVIQHGRPRRVQAPPGAPRDQDHAARRSAATGGCRSPTASAAASSSGAGLHGDRHPRQGADPALVVAAFDVPDPGRAAAVARGRGLDVIVPR